MKRLTTNTPKDNMETALNLFYIKDHETWVCGGGLAPEYKDISLFDFIRRAVASHIPDAELPEENDDLSMMMAEWLMDDIDTAEGILALLYTAAWAYAELRHRLAAYEDAGLTPEQAGQINESLAQIVQIIGDSSLDRLKELAQADKDGRLVVLPCKRGDAVWAIRNFKGTKHPQKGFVGEMFFLPDMTLQIVVKHIARGEFGKTVFLTREEAEKALKDGESDG